MALIDFSAILPFIFFSSGYQCKNMRRWWWVTTTSSYYCIQKNIVWRHNLRKYFLVRWHWLRLSIKSPRPPWQLFKATAAFTFTFLKATAHFTFTFFEGHHSLTFTFFTVRLVLGLRLTSNDVSMGHISRFSQSLMICLWVTSSNLSSHAFAFFAHPTPGSAVLWYSASISSWWSPTSWSS